MAYCPCPLAGAPRSACSPAPRVPTASGASDAQGERVLVGGGGEIGLGISRRLAPTPDVFVVDPRGLEILTTTRCILETPRVSGTTFALPFRAQAWGVGNDTDGGFWGTLETRTRTGGLQPAQSPRDARPGAPAHDRAAPKRAGSHREVGGAYRARAYAGRTSPTDHRTGGDVTRSIAGSAGRHGWATIARRWRVGSSCPRR
jgi:hypothetical protein